VYGAEKFLKESADKLEPRDRLAIESATNDVKKALEGGDAKAIDRTLDALMQAQQKAAERLYAKAGTPGGGPDAGGGAPGSAAMATRMT
jgi:molecular chaperone DnaK